METISSQVLEFEGKARTNPIGAPFLGKLLMLQANVRLDWKVIARYKHSSLFGLIDSGEGNMFYNIESWAQCYKTSFVCDLHIFVLNQSVLLHYPEKLTNDKHSSLLRKFVIYRQKSFITLTPVACTIKVLQLLFTIVLTMASTIKL